jgi:RHS repeat-associated protein
MNDNQWHYVEADLNAIVDMEYPGHTVARVDGLMVLGGDVYLDDIVFSGGRLRRSRQIVPGAALGGVLGSWTGPNVVAENGVTARYFQFNDLGTVLAQTKSDGTLEGAWEPDHFGNYEGRYAYSGSPARPELGLTGKIYDDAAGAYYVHARWLDSERGRFISEDLIYNSHLYLYCSSNPIDCYDADGLTEKFGPAAGALCNWSSEPLYVHYDRGARGRWCVVPPNKCTIEKVPDPVFDGLNGMDADFVWSPWWGDKVYKIGAWNINIDNGNFDSLWRKGKPAGTGKGRSWRPALPCEVKYLEIELDIFIYAPPIKLRIPYIDEPIPECPSLIDARRQ